MRINDFIKERYNTFSPAEKRIADKLINDKNVINLDIHNFAKECETSSATIVRFAKKLQTKGFQDLKVKLASQQDEMPLHDWSEGVNSDDTIQQIAYKSILSNINIYQKMYENLNYDVLYKVVEMLKKANRVFIFGVSGSSLVAQDMQYKLIKIRKDCIHVSDMHNQILLSKTVKEDDAVIVISYSGETKEVLHTVKNSNTENIVSITKMAENSLEKICNYNLYVPNSEGYLRLGAINSRLCTLALLDIIYLSMIPDQLDEIKNHIIESRELLK